MIFSASAAPGGSTVSASESDRRAAVDNATVITDELSARDYMTDVLGRN